MSQAPNIDPMAIDPVEFARQVGKASDEDLAAGLQNEEVRSLTLSEIFGRMARHFRADKGRRDRRGRPLEIFDRPGGGTTTTSGSSAMGPARSTTRPNTSRW
jgi:hypothetical protein